MKVTDLAVWMPNEPDGRIMTDETGAIPSFMIVCVCVHLSVYVTSIMYNRHIF